MTVDGGPAARRSADIPKEDNRGNRTIAKVEERLRPDMTSQGLFFSETEMHFVCPWHGMEYDMKTGECVSDRKLKLRKYQVVEKGDEVYVVAQGRNQGASPGRERQAEGGCKACPCQAEGRAAER